MDEYIKHKEVLALVKPDAPEDEKAAVTIATAKKLVRSIIQRAPAADVAPVVHGYWIDNGANGYKWAFICSRCGYVDGHPFDDRHNFCPSCGARMDGGSENG